MISQRCQDATKIRLQAFFEAGMDKMIFFSCAMLQNE